MKDVLNKKVGGYISKITFNNKQVININKNDIVIFVGPNNVGKSQSLKDIYTLLEKNVSTTVIKEIEIVKTCIDEFEDFVKNISCSKDYGNHKVYSGYGYSINSYNILDYKNYNFFGDARGIFVSFLNTENRLEICNPPEVIDVGKEKKHPIHYLIENDLYGKIVSNNFKKAFGKELIPNRLFGKTIPLCIGNKVNLDNINHNDFEQNLQEYGKILNTYEQVQNQGDGIRSFVGILLNLIIKTYCTYLIDEPESFLHPPQAKIMGHIIGELLDEKQQAFISTHSQEIIKGLLEVCPERIKIIRITRDQNINNFSILDNTQFNEIWKDPLLKYSEIMSSLFHKSVVLCESDSDCRLYSIILSHIKENLGHFSETLFIHCGGKQRMPKVIKALKALNINLIVIPDIDVLNDKNIIKRIVESCGDSWEKYESSYNKLQNNLKTQKNSIIRDEVKMKIDEVLNSSQDKELSKEEIGQIISNLKIETKWSVVKKGGKDIIPRGDGFSAFEQLDKLLKKVGIFLVPVGELENFVREVGGHGPEWVNKVLETYPNLDNEVYDKIIKFVKEWSKLQGDI